MFTGKERERILQKYKTISVKGTLHVYTKICCKWERCTMAQTTCSQIGMSTASCILWLCGSLFYHLGMIKFRHQFINCSELWGYPLYGYSSDCSWFSLFLGWWSHDDPVVWGFRSQGKCSPYCVSIHNMTHSPHCVSVHNMTTSPSVGNSSCQQWRRSDHFKEAPSISLWVNIEMISSVCCLHRYYWFWM